MYCTVLYLIAYCDSGVTPPSLHHKTWRFRTQHRVKQSVLKKLHHGGTQKAFLNFFTATQILLYDLPERMLVFGFSYLQVLDGWLLYTAFCLRTCGGVLPRYRLPYLVGVAQTNFEN